MGGTFSRGSRSWTTWLRSENSTVLTQQVPSVFFCFSIMALKPPMVSLSSPAMEPLRSRMNTSSVQLFFIL